MRITIKNYEEYALDYLEGRLDKDTTAEFENFLDRHPEIREELNQVQPVRLPDQETHSFPDKDNLLRDTPIIRAFKQPLYVPIWSIAACLLLLVGFFLWWNMTGPEPGNERQVATHPRFESAENQTALEDLKEEMNSRQLDIPMRSTSPSGEYQNVPNQINRRSTTQDKVEPSSPVERKTASSETVSTQYEIELIGALDIESSTSKTLALESLNTPEIDEFPERRPRLNPLSIQQPAPLTASEERHLSDIPTISSVPPEKKDSFFLSDELADFTPSSWPGQLNTEQIKEAFIPKAFSK